MDFGRPVGKLLRGQDGAGGLNQESGRGEGKAEVDGKIVEGRMFKHSGGKLDVDMEEMENGE